MYCFLYISQGADEENLFNNQELIALMTIFIILITFMYELEVIM